MAAGISDIGYRNVLDAAVGQLFWNTLHLFQNNFVPGPSNVVGDFVEATYSGYAANNLVFAPSFINGGGKGEADAGSFTFVRGVGATDNTIYGVYVLSAAGDMTYYERFAFPVTMVIPFVDNIPYQVVVTDVNG